MSGGSRVGEEPHGRKEEREGVGKQKCAEEEIK